MELREIPVNKRGEKEMGFTVIVAVVFLLFLVVGAIAAARGERLLAVSMAAVTALGTVSLWMLWAASPM